MMFVRFGNVLYWAACGIAVPLLVFAGYIAKTDTGPFALEGASMFAVMAVLVWLIGRACRYVLGGR
jgi:hypothetical protein